MPSVPHTPRVVHPVNPPDKRMNAHETVRAESLQDAANKGTWKYGQSAGGGWRCESVNVTACSRGNFLVSYGFARPASPDWLFLIRNGFVSANEVRREAATPVPERTTHRCYTGESARGKSPLRTSPSGRLGASSTFFGAVDYGGRMSKAEWERRVGDAGGRQPVRRRRSSPTPATTVSLEAMQAQPRRLPPDGRARPVEPRRQARLHHPRDPQRATSGRCRHGPADVPDAGAMDNQWYDGFPKIIKTDGSKYGHRAASGGWFAYCDYAGFDFYLYTWGRPESVGFPVIERCLDRATSGVAASPSTCSSRRVRRASPRP
jgi:hypothetical protein